MTTTLQRRTILAAAVAAIALAGAARADPDLADLKVVDRATGQVLPTWRHHGRLFVAGRPGALYSLRLSNHTDGRLLLVISVDGVNILTGETAGYSQRGYVLYPHAGYDVNGWRKSTDEVAAFAFAPLPQSYAAETGRPTEVGVIGMAVFEERQSPGLPPLPYFAAPPPPPPPPSALLMKGRAVVPPPPPLYIRPVEAPRPPPPAPPVLASPAPPPPRPAIVASRMPPNADAAGFPVRRDEEKLGTAHGAREWSVATLTTFTRATSYPRMVRRIEYDTYARLVAAGVVPALPPEHRPRPFPANDDAAGFVPDPPAEP